MNRSIMATRAQNRAKRVIKLSLKRRNGNGNGGTKRTTTRMSKSRSALQAIAQGVGATTRRPFQMRPQAARRLCDYFTATLPAHLPLPRSVGPYTVIRTTQVVQSASTTAFFAFLRSNAGTGFTQDQWIAASGISSTGAGVPISGLNTSNLLPMVGLDPLLLSCTVSPAAMTVQVMNPNALQTTSGIVYIGRSSAQYELGGSTRTWDNLGNEFVQFMSPRLCSAGKLALRGVTVDSYPLDMSAVSDFAGIRAYADVGTPFTWANDFVVPAGFAPIVVYNPGLVNLQYLVTMEWRVRFDPSNPASGSHAYHGTAPDSLWDRATREAAAAGHGVLDIAEKTAEVGAMGMSALEVGAILA